MKRTEQAAGKGGLFAFWHPATGSSHAPAMRAFRGDSSRQDDIRIGNRSMSNRAGTLGMIADYLC
jgi:hypothetical protein